MSNIFSTFDPISRFRLFNNWLSRVIVLIFIPISFWIIKSPFSYILRYIFNILHKEFKINFTSIPTPGHTHWAAGIFLFVFLNNFWGITPYTFTRSRHLTFALTLGLTFWVSYFLISLIKDTTHSLAHLVPLGTPVLLLPLMVIIETISNIIRPLTLSVRLVANLVAGHLLITLTAYPISTSFFNLSSLVILPLFVLIVLESAVALIQAYVFSILRTLYLREVNFSTLQ